MTIKILLPLLTAIIVFAQPPGAGRGARGDRAPAFDHIKSYLNLSDTQIASITAARKSSAESMRALASQMRTKQQALRATLDSGTTDATAVGRATLEIQALRKQMEASRAKTQEQALSFLSAEQKSKLQTLEESRSLRRELREAHMLQLLAPEEGRGGPRGPGMGAGGRFHRK